MMMQESGEVLTHLAQTAAPAAAYAAGSVQSHSESPGNMNIPPQLDSPAGFRKSHSPLQEIQEMTTPVAPGSKLKIIHSFSDVAETTESSPVAAVEGAVAVAPNSGVQIVT